MDEQRIIVSKLKGRIPSVKWFMPAAMPVRVQFRRLLETGPKARYARYDLSEKGRERRDRYRERYNELARARYKGNRARREYLNQKQREYRARDKCLP